MKNTLLLILCFLCFNISAQDKNLDKIINDYESYLDENNERTNNSWPQNSLINYQEEYKNWRSFLDQLDDLNQSTLQDQDLINYELLRLIINDKHDNLLYETHYFPLNAEGGFITSMIYATKNLKLKDEKSVNAYLSKLKDTKRYINQQISWMHKGLEEGKAMPQLIATNCISILDKAINNDLDFLRRPLESDHLTAELRQEAAQLIDGEIKASFLNLLNFLKEDYLTLAPETVGVSEMKDGKAYYEQRVRYFTTLDLSPEEVYNIGLSEVKRIKAEMSQIIVDLKYDGDFDSFIQFLREDPQFYAETPQELLSHAAWLSMKAQEILPKYFTKLPRLPFTVNPVPEAIAPTYTTGRYSGGSMADSKAGEYWVNTYNLSARPMYVLPALTLHEAVPGHHLQISLAKEIQDLPDFRTTQYLSAFGEGWGLYAEYLGQEAGIYTTPYEEFGRLTYEMWRACRLVIDPGIHYFGWTREEALDYMASNTSLSMHEINTEIDRYIGWPGQAVSYKIGELKIRELRQRAEETLGEAFDIKAFHDLILSYGSIPLSTLERIVDRYISN